MKLPQYFRPIISTAFEQMDETGGKVKRTVVHTDPVYPYYYHEKKVVPRRAPQ